MSDELLPYYNRELAFLRNMGEEFAKANPKIAARLRLDSNMAEDPHVARMIEAFAYLNARTRHKIEDDFPEISEAMLNILYPHYLAPIPSMSIVQFGLDRGQADLTDGYAIDRHSTVETEPIEGQPCRFRTCYPVTLWPFDVKDAAMQGEPFRAPATSFSKDARSIIRLDLECFSSKAGFKQMSTDTMRFYLNGQSLHIYPLYEAIFNNTIGVILASDAEDKEPVILGSDCIQPVGFGRDEGVVEFSARSFLGYRLLSEYFAFPEKFFFFDLKLSPAQLSRFESSMQVYLYLDQYSQDLERNIDEDTFQLGCTPMINLFRQRAEPIVLTHTEHEYHVVPDARRPRAYEIASIDRVVATSPDNEEVEFLPFYSLEHGRDLGEHQRFWNASRRRAGYAGGEVDHGTEIYLQLVDLEFQPSVPTQWTIDIETTCLNRDLPHRLPFGGNQPRLQLSVGAPLSTIQCLTPPTPTLRPSLRHGTLWRLISHLSLNHLSLVDGENNAEPLREILKLYDFHDSAETRAMIDGLQSVASRRSVGRVGGPVSAGFCRGVEVTLDFDEEKFTGTGVYLLASVLDRFLGLYSSINSFTKTKITTKQREGTLCQWPPRAGERTLL